jgi:excisionase family DNA binding protein
MELKQAKEMFKAGAAYSPAKNLYEAAYAYAQATGFDPMETPQGWHKARQLLEAIAVPDGSHLVAEALSYWMLDSNTMDVRGVQEKIAGLLKRAEGFSGRYIRDEIERGTLKAWKQGRGWLISQRAFREWWENPERGEVRGGRSDAR